jgi:hypothetical protein
VILSALALTGPSAGASIATGELWVTRYNGSANDYDTANSIAVSPDGARTFVTGKSPGSGTSDDYATVAYDTASGAQVWAARYNDPVDGIDTAYSVAVSADGTVVFVTGTSDGDGTFYDFATLAYSADSGDELWTARFDGPAGSDDGAIDLAVSADGSRLFVTGWAQGLSTGQDYATVAYDTSTGDPVWTKRYNGPSGSDDAASMVAVSPDGSTVFVSGMSYGGSSREDYATIAYAASSGATLWSERYNDPGNWDDIPSALAVSADGSTVFVTGQGGSSSSSQTDYVTLAYDGLNGALRWDRRYDGPGGGYDVGRAIAESADGSKVFVTGVAAGGASLNDYATLAYEAGSGALLWSRRYNGPGNGNDDAAAVAVSPDGASVAVTGGSKGGTGTGVDYATLGYDTSTGVRLWSRRYAATRYDGGSALAFTPDGSRVVVTGASSRPTTGLDYATLAYPA